MAIHLPDGQQFETSEEMMVYLMASRTTWDKIRAMVWVRPRRRIRDVQLSVKWAWQRVFRGWDDRASWETGHYLGKHLGELLVAQAGFAHGWPGDPWTYDTWVAALKENGEALLAWHAMDDTEDKTEWEPTYARAQEALRWVADNLATLWD